MKIPKIKTVNPLDNMCLFVVFDNGITKIYDTKKLVTKIPEFEDLKNKNLFKRVKIEASGYGVTWNENLDLSRYEIWKHGIKFKKDQNNG